MTCSLGYKDRPCTFQGQRAHYFITVYRDTSDGWGVRTEYHGPRRRSASNVNSKHFGTYDEARQFAEKKHAQWSAFPEGLPIVIELGEAIA